jgi:type IV fimbrial biogenesis protein FimT
VKNTGFTLLEGLVTLTVAIIFSLLAIPEFADLLARQRATAAINQMLGAIHMTRHAAISQRRLTVLCASEERACLGRNEWHRGAMVFADLNGDGKRAQAEPVITQLPPLHTGARVSWRSFQNKPYIRFRPNGATDWQNGSFTYCPGNGDLSLAKRITLNVQGRVAKSTDRNQDGIDEDGRGRPLRCG